MTLKATLLAAVATSLLLTACGKPAAPSGDATQPEGTASPAGEIKSADVHPENDDSGGSPQAEGALAAASAKKESQMTQKVPASPAGALELFVAPTGSDANNGTKAAPFATLERARDAARAWRKTNAAGQAVTIHLRGGVYEREGSFALTQQDSGAPGAPLVIASYGDEKVSILGGLQLALSDFKPVSDEATLERLPAEARGKVRQADLRALGITEYGELPLYGHGMHSLDAVTSYKSGPPMPELFVNGVPMTLARWPNDGFTKIQSITEMGSIPRNWMDDVKGSTQTIAAPGNGWVPPEKRENPPKGFAFTVESDRLARWTQAEDPRMFGYWYWDWSDQSVQIKSVKPESRTIESVQPSAYGLKVGQRFYAYNMIEELDAPGEWYLDRKTGILYLYPPSDDPKALVQISLCAEPLIKMTGASQVVLRGLTMGVSRTEGVAIEGGEDVVIERCTIGLVGGDAVTIAGGARHGVADSMIHDTGAGGISLTGGKRQTLEPAGHFAEHNEIRNFSRIQRTYTPAVALNGVGNRAVGNRISGSPHTGLLFGGNNHLVEGNEIFDVCRQADDMGAIYSCPRDYSSRGTVIRHNYIHDIRSDSTAHCGSHALYLDDAKSGVEFYSNWVVNVSGMGVLINGGRDNQIKNNTFIRARAAVSISDFRMDKRFIFGADAPIAKGIDINSDPFLKYENLANMAEDEPRAPKYNLIMGNRNFDAKAFHFWKFRTDNTEADIRTWNEIEGNEEFPIGPRKK